MKNTITRVLMLLFTVGIYAQGINYKALIKDNLGNVVASQMVTVQFQILQGAGMANVYQETHTPMTDANGIIIISIGEGTRDSGVFANIDWGADDHFLNTQIDTGAGLIDMGTSGFKTVPYALYAKTAGNLPDGINESNYLRWDATNSAWVVGDSKIAIGHEAGQTNQGISAVATGFRAGQTNQGLQSVATGAFAGSETQGEYSVAIGFEAGQTTQGTNSVATGKRAGQTNQGSSAVAIGHAAGFMNQGTNSIAIGHEAGWLDQHFNSIVLNATGVTLNTASTNAFYVAPIRSENTSLQLYYNTGTNEVTYGAVNLPDGINESNYLRWDATNSAWVVGDSKIAIGNKAGQTNQGTNSVAIGNWAGQTNQGYNSVAIGNVAGITQGYNSVATGFRAGQTNQGSQSVAIGDAAGQLNQGSQSVATGYAAGNDTQGSKSVAIGEGAGQIGQGTESVAIGAFAGKTLQHANSIVLNAIGFPLNTTSTDAFYVAPIRSENTSLQLYYNTGTKEVTYGNSTPISTVMTDVELRSVTTTWTQGPSFNTITGFKASSLVKISYIIPSRNDFSGWGGLFIEPQISFDDGSIWKSLGSSGFDGGIMHENSASVGSYTNTLLIDPAQTTNFSVKIRFYFRSYQGTTFINNSNGINTISGTATIMSGTNGAQHYTKVIVEEVFQ